MDRLELEDKYFRLTEENWVRINIFFFFCRVCRLGWVGWGVGGHHTRASDNYARLLLRVFKGCLLHTLTDNEMML